ncbi:signal peptide peptidase SppA [Tepidamorphus sp. 3E244]|uniref:signal peptide peptidase SppA n=1 Tax=Tepidamorphus sp. 3E244 TaxID=3385498 RepID=UPI0038FC989D
MALDADTLVERRSLRRKLSFWRIAAFIIAVGAIVAIAGLSARDKIVGQIARVPVTGVITDSFKQREMLRKLGETDRVKAVILAIDSPGGTTSGGESLFNAIRDLAGKKPVVASIGTVGASAAYLVAIAADHVVARETSITGSIGVLYQWPNFKELGDKVGVDMRVIKSDPLKAEPSPFNEDTPAELRVIEQLIGDTHDWFIERVSERRGLEANRARELADGRVYSGRRAVTMDLVDELGGEDTAQAWLVAERGVPEGLRIVQWTGDAALEELGLGGRLSQMLDGAGKFAGWLSDIAEEAVPQRGLVSIWRSQPIED